MSIKTVWELNQVGGTSSDQAAKENYKFINKWKDREDYLENTSILKEALNEYELLSKAYGIGGDELYKVILEGVLDQNDPNIKARYNKLHEKAIKVANDIEFFTLRLARIPAEKQNEFLLAPELKEYEHFLEGLFEMARHLLSEPEEKILNLKSKVAHENWVDMTKSLLSKEERDGKSLAKIMDLVSDQNKEMRDQAAQWLNEILADHIDEGEHEINSVLENSKIDLELRKYARPDHPRHISDDIDTKVVDALLKTASDNFDISHRYYELKAKLFGVEKLEYHERNVPYGKTEKKMSFDEAAELVGKTFAKLDPWFSEIFKEYLASGRIDAFPKVNKSTGAACISNLQTQPTYIYLNYTNKLRNITTLAHEMGHAIHNELTNQRQNALNSGSSLAIAEVASTFMEDFVIQEIMEKADEELKLALQMEQLNDLVSSIQRQVACYNFELGLHESFKQEGYLSQKEIGKIFQKHMASYMGNFVNQSEGSENWWLYWSHIRNSFYVYSYASGLLISKTLQAYVKKDPGFIENIKECLSLGTSKSPKEAFLTVGIDISNKGFWLQGLEEQRTLLDETWTLAEKLGKI